MQATSKQLAQHIARTIAEEIGAQTAQALAGAMIKLVLKTEPDKLKF
jgi:hypothetical protein